MQRLSGVTSQSYASTRTPWAAASRRASAEGGMGGVIGCDALNIFYLYHKKQGRVKAALRRPLKLPDMPDARAPSAHQETGLFRLFPASRPSPPQDGGPPAFPDRNPAGTRRRRYSGRMAVTSGRNLPDAAHSAKTLLGACASILIRGLPFFHSDQVIGGFPIWDSFPFPDTRCIPASAAPGTGRCSSHGRFPPPRPAPHGQ